ncbi:hypothetical protein K402DRAFT_426033 [Aulographum hederae CBS 113979]|uniref:Uncharacterized protein n=1 Tax=Aulographum hederae CBS 113979 TaxID=1176131 RepID=A0A6G1GIA7_9PEZI|nr:hypothetical protein K402DRAFT_426033 [Aulographum hederae CBS 113979]
MRRVRMLRETTSFTDFQREVLVQSSIVEAGSSFVDQFTTDFVVEHEEELEDYYKDDKRDEEGERQTTLQDILGEAEAKLDARGAWDLGEGDDFKGHVIEEDGA